MKYGRICYHEIWIILLKSPGQMLNVFMAGGEKRVRSRKIGYLWISYVILLMDTGLSNAVSDFNLSLLVSVQFMNVG